MGDNSTGVRWFGDPTILFGILESAGRPGLLKEVLDRVAGGPTISQYRGLQAAARVKRERGEHDHPYCQFLEQVQRERENAVPNGDMARYNVQLSLDQAMLMLSEVKQARAKDKPRNGKHAPVCGKCGAGGRAGETWMIDGKCCQCGARANAHWAPATA